MPNHILGDVDRHMAPAIMDSKCMANHLREDGARPTPRSDDRLIAALVHLFNFF
jgi:predicted RNA-binding protein